MAKFLQKDYEALLEKIEETTDRLKNAMHEGSESAGESSETWHDNFGFEEASRQQKMHMKQLDELNELRHSAEIVQPKKGGDTVDVGSRVRLVNTATDEEKEFVVGSYMVLDKKEDLEVAYTAPIIAPFFGARAGDMYEVSLGGKKVEFELVEIK